MANFARACQYAGAKSALMSLWPVASRETVELVTMFYGHLQASKPRTQPLWLSRRPSKPNTPSPSSGLS